jgi:uncharacterized protein YoxC
MATKKRKHTLTERLNKLADDLEKKPKCKAPVSEKGETAGDALDRLEKAVESLP